MDKKLLTEFVGTLLFVTAIGLTVATQSVLTPLAIGAALMGLVYMGVHVSGAHYNPAVSLAILIRGMMTAGEMVRYWIAQTLGAVAGGFIADFIVGTTFAPAPGAGVALGPAMLVEVMFTMMLVLVVLNVATAKATSGNSFYGLAIGFTVVAAVTFGEPVSGGSFNPAVATGAIVSDALAGGGTWADLWIYWVGPLVGGLLGALIFKIQHDSEPVEG